MPLLLAIAEVEREGVGRVWLCRGYTSLYHEDGVVVPVDPGLAFQSLAEELRESEHPPVRFRVVVPQRLVDALGDGGIPFIVRQFRQGRV